ncbi:MAG: Gfo/Idh/MocA family oxidoreductase, partial [Myxococcota bacterium]
MLTVEPVRIVVVGAGHLGTYHLEKLAADDAAELIGVVEIDAERRDRAATDHGMEGATELSTFRDRAEAAVIATPTTTHLELAVAALDLGMHVLVEKPIAATVDEALRLEGLAADCGLVVQVGHTERFNPAVTAALAIADRPRYVVAERLAPFSGRSTDIDVILDLMIHDLDIVASIIPSALTEVRAIGVPVLTQAVDMASARLEFADGSVAQLSAGRASMEPARKIRLFTMERYLSIDCASGDVKSVRRLPPEPGSSWPQIVGEPVEVPEGDALALQDHDFLVCIRESRAPRVDARAGRRALELAVAVIDALR